MDIRIDKINNNYHNSTSIRQTTFTSQKEEFTPSKQLEQLKKAQQYVDSITHKGKILNLDKCNLKKLEGIQNGIKVFEGLNIEQIYLLYKHLAIVATSHGCTNGCVHCFVDAKPIRTSDPSHIKAMSWEDFEQITKGFAELDKRLGFTKKHKNPISNRPIIVPFIDADSMEITIKDKHGVEHDMMEIVHKINTDMHRSVLFDTAGWTPKNTKLQQRAEKYVQYMLSHSGTAKSEFVGINLSLNPFHKINSKYVEYIKSDPAKAQKFRNIYTDRMANAFYTFTPLFGKKEFRFLNRALPVDANCNENYKLEAHRQLISEIREKLKARYISSGMSEENIRKNLEIFDEKTSQIATHRVLAYGRMERLFKPYDKEYIIAQKAHLKNTKNPTGVIVNNIYGQLIIDCNGKVYASDMADFFPTDICLNLSNKDKISQMSFPIRDRILTTKEIIKESKKIHFKKIANQTLQYLRKLIYRLKKF